MKLNCVRCTTFIALIIIATPALAFSSVNTPYSDARLLGIESNIALNYLTDEGIITGNPDGTYKPYSTLNRAEFVTIAMRVLQARLAEFDTPLELEAPSNCYPDVQKNSWYSSTVCTATTLGIIEGYATEAGKIFAPEKPVSYVEALKILTLVSVQDIDDALPGAVWYTPFTEFALRENVTLETVPLDAYLNREQVALLTARYVAWVQGLLDEYYASILMPSEPSSSSTSSVASSSSSTSSVQTSSQSSAANAQYDTLPVTAVRSNFIPLGATSPLVGAVTLFSAQQPVFLREVTINIVAQVNSISAFAVYQSDGKLLGNATRKSATQYQLPLGNSDVHIKKQFEQGYYIRPLSKAIDAGGSSGEQLQLQSIMLKVEGEWDNSIQTITDSSTYPVFITAASALEKVTGAARAEDLFLTGTNVRIGSFTFAGSKSDARADARITNLFITANATLGVTLSNIVLRDNAGSTETPCIFTTRIECTNIPENVGSFEDTDRTLTVYADVAAPSGETYLQLSLNVPGSPAQAGDVHWTDGFTNFTWVYADAPLATSTAYKR